MQSTLINFNVPEGIRHRFDEVCRESGRTRTSVLVELMEAYVLTQGKALADRHAEIRKVDQTLAEIRQLRASDGFLRHQVGRDQIARQSPVNWDSVPLSILCDDDDPEELYREFLASRDRYDDD